MKFCHEINAEAIQTRSTFLQPSRILKKKNSQIVPKIWIDSFEHFGFQRHVTVTAANFQRRIRFVFVMKHNDPGALYHTS